MEINLTAVSSLDRSLMDSGKVAAGVGKLEVSTTAVVGRRYWCRIAAHNGEQMKTSD